MARARVCVCVGGVGFGMAPRVISSSSSCLCLLPRVLADKRFRGSNRLLGQSRQIRLAAQSRSAFLCRDTFQLDHAKDIINRSRTATHVSSAAATTGTKGRNRHAAPRRIQEQEQDSSNNAALPCTSYLVRSIEALPTARMLIKRSGRQHPARTDEIAFVCSPAHVGKYSLPFHLIVCPVPQIRFAGWPPEQAVRARDFTILVLSSVFCCIRPDLLTAAVLCVLTDDTARILPPPPGCQHA